MRCTTVLLACLVLLPPFPIESYQILGGIDKNGGESSRAASDNRHVEHLRHLGLSLSLDQQRYESDGSVSMAGKAWEASHVMADYLTNPLLSIRPREASETSPATSIDQDHKDDDNNNKCVVLELGSGIGICSIAAALRGNVVDAVIATDASSISLDLIECNVARVRQEQIDKEKHSTTAVPTTRQMAPVHVHSLLWGQPIDAEIRQLVSSYGLQHPSLVVASDVVYQYSNRQAFQQTINELCGPDTQILLAHTWRTEPERDEAYFESFANLGLSVEQVDPQLLPPIYQRISMYGKQPVSLFSMKRKPTV